MKTTNDMLDNLCFEDNENTKRADEALNLTLKKEEFWFVLRGWTSGFDQDTGDALYFFPLEDLSRVCEDTRKKFLADIRKNWEKASFEIIEEKELTGDVYFHVGFRSIFFRLKNKI